MTTKRYQLTEIPFFYKEKKEQLNNDSPTVENSFHDQIMDIRPELTDFFIAPYGMNPVGQKNDHGLLQGIHPERGPGKAKVPEGSR